jgi:phage shock protein C
MRDDIKRLYRSNTERRIAGLCAGIGLFFRIDPTFVRIAWIAVTLLTGFVPGTVAYLISWIVVPLEPLPAVPSHVEHTAGSPA